MSNIVTYEIYRPVLLPDDGGAEFLQRITSLGRSAFDKAGTTIVSSTNNPVLERTVSSGGIYYGDNELRYPHYYGSGFDAKKLGKKVYEADERLFRDDDNPVDFFEVDLTNTSVEQVAGKESLRRTLGRVAFEEYCIDPDDEIDLILDNVRLAFDHFRYPLQAIISLESTPPQEQYGRSNESMLRRMSHITDIAVRSSLQRHDELNMSDMIDSVPIARTREQDQSVLHDFVSETKRLLPLRVQVASLASSFRSK